MPYHPSYYRTLWEKAGYDKEKDLLAWRITQAKCLTPKILREGASLY